MSVVDIGGSCVGNGTAGEGRADYVSIGAVVVGWLDVVVGSPDAEGVDVWFVEASVALASADVGGVPRVEGKGHAKPAEVASRLFSMGETVNQIKV